MAEVAQQQVIRIKMVVLTPNHVNTMQLHSILNRIQKQRSFVYDHAQFVERGGKLGIVVAVRERRGCRLA
jgi:hypothetical protein